MPDFIIYRIIGNSLPPRHDGEETYRNLAFILDREPELPGCEKRWILNEFIDRQLEDRCRALIEAKGQAYHRIAFDAVPFLTTFYDSSGLPRQYRPFAGEEFVGLPPLAVEWMLRHKSLALINLNRARNRAIELGRSEARWVLPLDGWACFTAEAWQAFVDAVRARDDVFYAFIPLARLSDNAQLETPERLPPADDEPQIAFRSDAPDRFDERRRYGNWNKVDLLRRLGMPGPWHRWVPAAWDTMEPLETHAPGSFCLCSQVYRLASGAAPEIEKDSDTRHLARFRGVGRLAARLERNLLARAHGARGCEHAVLRQGQRVPDAAALSELLAQADALAGEPMPMMGGRAAGPAGAGRLDFVSGYGSGERSGPDDAAGQLSDLATLRQGLRRAAILAAGGIHGGNRDHQARAADVLHAWFADPATAMTPHARFARHVPERPGWANPAGWLDLRDLWLLPALCRSLVVAGALPLSAREAIRVWAGQLHDALSDTEQGTAAYQAADHTGTWTHLLRLSLGLFLGRYQQASSDLGGATLRLAAQCAPDGSQPAELAGERPLYGSLFNLSAWTLLAALGRSNGVDLWRYSGVDGESICRMTAYIAGRQGTFAEAADDPGYWSAWIGALCLLAPADAADRDLLPAPTAACRRWRDDPGWGLPPAWPVFLGPHAG